jgi:hypothetical protein
VSVLFILPRHSSSLIALRLNFRLALCDAHWQSLPQIVFSRFFKKVEEGIPQGISNVIFSLSKMDVSWEELDEEMCLSIERMIEKRKDDFSIQVS